jgi:outer membrane protein assembly factor BamB
VNGANRVIFLGTQGGTVYTLNAETGGVAWSSALPDPSPAPVQATVSGYFTFAAGKDYLLVGTRGSGALNRFYALRLSNGGVEWSYDGAADGLKIGIIAAQASVDLANGRVYFTSTAYGTGTGEKDTVWCLDIITGNRVWSAEVPDATMSPILRGGRVYVATYDGVGRIHALDATTGASVWGGASFSTGAGEPVKAFVGADRLSPAGTGRLIFSTTTKVWALNDPAGSSSPPVTWQWRRDALSEPALDRIPDPSTPGFLAGGPHVWLGASNGTLYRLDYDTGATQLTIPLGDPAAPAALGSPTLDIRDGFLYVGSESGLVYAVKLP